MTVLAEIGEDARFLTLLLEAFERALEVLVIVDYDFRQNLLPPFVAFAAPINGQTLKLGAALLWVKLNWRLEARQFVMLIGLQTED